MKTRLLPAFGGVVVGLAAAASLANNPAPATVVTQPVASAEPTFQSADLAATQAQLDQVTWFMIGLQQRVTDHNGMVSTTFEDLRRQIDDVRGRVEELERQVGVHSIYRRSITSLWAEVDRLDREINGGW